MGLLFDAECSGAPCFETDPCLSIKFWMACRTTAGKVLSECGERCFQLLMFRAKKYGDTADECGEAFFLCGKALLDMAR